MKKMPRKGLFLGWKPIFLALAAVVLLTAVLQFVLRRGDRSAIQTSARRLTAAAYAADRPLLQQGRLIFEIRDAKTQKPIPGKLVFLQDGRPAEVQVPTSDSLASSGNTVYTAGGRGEVRLAAGDYEVWIGHGLEYSATVQPLHISAGGTARITAVLRREVDTRGYIGGDLHLHTLTYSNHGDARLRERLISCLGEGLEWVVITDHNHNTDLRALARRMGLRGRLAVAIGNEITMNAGHMNVYPLAEADRDSLYPAPIRGLLQSTELQLLRLILSPPHRFIRQLNHPRSNRVNYLTRLGLDGDSGELSAPEWALGFDAMEVLNGNRGSGWEPDAHTPLSVRQDWFHLLNRGRRITAVGNSDSHEVSAVVAGVPRNYIASSTDDPANLFDAELVESILRQRVTVNRGLFVELRGEDGTPMGGRITAVNGRARLHIRVQAPGWIDCDSVLVYENGDVRFRFRVAPSTEAVRFDRELVVEPPGDAWYVVVAAGGRPLGPLVDTAPFPIFPLGFTNPIWVDADGDGKITPVQTQIAQKAKQQAAHPLRWLQKFRSQPTQFCLAVQHLPDSSARMRTKWLTAMLNDVPLQSRLFLYRELKRLATPKAVEALQRAAKEGALPLERITAQRLLFSLSNKKQSGDMAKLLDYLHATFLNYRHGTRLRNWHVQWDAESGAVAKELLTSKEGRPISPIPISSRDDSAGLPFFPPADGVLRLDRLPRAQPRQAARVNCTFSSRRSGRLPFFIDAAPGLRILLNGKTIAFTKPGKGALQLPIQELSVREGINRIEIQWPANGENLRLSMEPVDLRGWIDPLFDRKLRHSHLARGKSVRLKFHPHKRYAQSPALVDGVFGSSSGKDGAWLGVQKQDFEAVVDLGAPTSLTQLSTRFLQNLGDWAFLPVFVEYSISQDGNHFQLLGILGHTEPRDTPTPLIKSFPLNVRGARGRYVRIRAKNIGTCPEWHAGAGNGALLLIDEILIR